MRFCHYFGQYFCAQCHTGQTSVLPAQVIRNWNFSKFPVCDHAVTLIMGKGKKPAIDLSIHNPEIYEDARLPFRTLRKTRERNLFVSEYVDKCKRKEELDGIMGEKAHFFRSVHIYSLTDLIEIKGGTLLPLLDTIYGKLVAHIMKCDGCTGRAFICEICYSKELLFPFEFEKIGRCLDCGRVFHKKCYELLRASQGNCPVCVRSQKIKGGKE